MKQLLVVPLLASVLALLAGEAVGQYSWTKDTRNPVLSGGAAGSWNRHVFMPCVLYNSDSSRYEMWFGASAGTTSDFRPYRVGYAYSKDGVNWTMHPSPVLEPGPGLWESYTIEEAMVVRESGQYKMWYSGSSSSSWAGCSIGYATSSDGIHWTKYTGNPVVVPGPAPGEAGVYSSAVIPFSGGYKMWYGSMNTNGTNNIGYAVSADGITWQKDLVNNPVLVPTSGQWEYPYLMTPHVLQLGSTYFMWYLGMDAAASYHRGGLAASTDTGRTWAKYLGNPVLVPSAGWDNSQVEPGEVLLRGDTLDMWYGACNNSGLWKIGHATSLICSYANVVTGTPPYVRPALDTVDVTAEVMNPLFHTCGISVVTSNRTSGAQCDSLPMFDDGAHGDLAPNDGLWGCRLKAPSEEGIFCVCVRTDDETRGSCHRVGDAFRFTTAGPLTLDSVYVTRYGSSSYKLQPYVKNNGTSFTVRGASIQITCNDPWIGGTRTWALGLTDLVPGSIVTSTQFIGIPTDTATFPGYFNVKAEIRSDGVVYWTDSLKAVVTGVAEEVEVPLCYRLEQNYPNPFNPSTTIKYELPQQAHVVLTVFNMLGQEVATLLDEVVDAGYHESQFDASDLASGVYLYRLQAGDFMHTRKLVLLR